MTMIIIVITQPIQEDLYVLHNVHIFVFVNRLQMKALSFEYAHCYRFIPSTPFTHSQRNFNIEQRGNCLKTHRSCIQDGAQPASLHRAGLVVCRLSVPSGSAEGTLCCSLLRAERPEICARLPEGWGAFRRSVPDCRKAEGPSSTAFSICNLTILVFQL